MVDRWRWAWPLVTGLLWVGQEALRDRTPFGGFPWGRLAFSQGDSPLLRLAALGGAPLVTFAVALAGGLLAAAVLAAVGPRPAGWRPAAGRARRRSRLPVALLVAAGAGAGPRSRWPAPRRAETGGTVAIVQGNVPRLGLDFNAQRRAVLDNHVSATLDAGRAGGRRCRAAAGPGGLAGELQRHRPAAQRRRRGRGSRRPPTRSARRSWSARCCEGPGRGRYATSGLVWQPGTGPDGQLYVKRHPVPFAEYVPLRSYRADGQRRRSTWSATTSSAGDRAGVLHAAPVTVGDVICFEVAYDGVVRDTVTGGAQLLVVQTNNATFNEAEARQQLAMVRLRAVEHGRDALMASTVGVSGVRRRRRAGVRRDRVLHRRGHGARACA